MMLTIEAPRARLSLNFEERGLARDITKCEASQDVG